LDWLELVDDETRGLKSREELETILEDRGITPDHRVVLYCNTARRISHTYVVLRHLGYEHVEFYEGSLTEWEDRDGELVSED
jgi:thiosulfate/3-mercaptopyruvate sulfurtransferase